MIGVGMLTGLQTALLREQDGNGSVSRPSAYDVCQLSAKPEYFSEQNKACCRHVHTLWFGLVQLYFQCGDVWVEFARPVYGLRSRIAAPEILGLS